jgi:hypothetical protein
MLSPEERRQITDALTTWAKGAPVEPMIGLLGEGRFLTPWELVRHVTDETSEGQAVLEIIEHGVRREGIDSVVRRLSHTHG